jgi:hypothetical protein
MPEPQKPTTPKNTQNKQTTPQPEVKKTTEEKKVAVPDLTQKIKLDVELLKRDISVFDKYFQKIDTTLEKLGEATGQITRMISLHDERLVQSQQDALELKQLIEERRKETHSIISELERNMDLQADKWSEGEKRITESIHTVKTDLLTEMGHAKDSTDARLKRMEIWRAVVIGGAMVIFFFGGEFVKSYYDKFWTEMQINQQPTVSIPVRQK